MRAPYVRDTRFGRNDTSSRQQDFLDAVVFDIGTKRVRIGHGPVQRLPG